MALLNDTRSHQCPGMMLVQSKNRQGGGISLDVAEITVQFNLRAENRLIYCLMLS